jgi:hypothetical protein
MQEILNPAQPSDLRPDAIDQPRGARVDAMVGRCPKRRLCQKLGRYRLVGRRIGCAERTFRSGNHNGTPAQQRLFYQHADCGPAENYSAGVSSLQCWQLICSCDAIWACALQDHVLF